MPRTLKIISLTLLGLLLLVVAAAVVVLLTFDPNRYRGEIARAVETQTGRQLTIDGDLHLTLFPWLGLKSGTVALGNAPGFGDTPFVRLDELEVRVRIVPLLHREVEMGKVVVRGLTLHLARDAAGRTNWDDLVAAGEKGEGKGSTHGGGEGGASPPPAAAALPVAALAIGGLEVHDASLVWDDRQAGQRVVLDHLTVESGPVRLDAPIHLTLSGDGRVSQPVLTGHMEGKVTVTPDLDHQRFELKGIHFTGRVAGPTLPVMAARAEVTGAATLDLAAQRYRGDDLHLTVEVDGPLSGRATVTASAEANLTSGHVAARGVHMTAHVEGKSLPGGKADATVAADLAGNLNRRHFDVSHLDVTARGGGAIGGSAHLTLPALSADLSTGRLLAKSIRLTAHVEGASLPGGKADATVAADLSGNLNRRHFEVHTLDVTAATAAAPGAVAGSGRLAVPTLSVELDGPRVEAKRLLLEGEARGGALPGKRIKGTVAADVFADLAKGVAVVSDLHLTTLGLDLRGGVRATGLGAKPVATGTLRLAPFDPRALLARLGQSPPETADSKVLRRASLSTRLEATPDRLRLTKLKVGLDKSTLTGWFAVRDFGAPAVRGELTVDHIDVDRYLPPAKSAKSAARGEGPPKAQGATPVATPAAAAAAAATLPVAPLRDLDVDATVRVGRLKVSGVRVADLLLTLKAKGGKLRLHPAAAKLYGGTYAGDARLDVTSRLPRVALHDRLTAVHLGPLLKDATGKVPATGTATVEARLHATGGDPDALLATLAGDGRFAVKDGAITGVDVGQVLRNAEALLHGGRAAARGSGDKTDFSEITGTFKVAKGVVANHDLAGKAPLLRLAGRGEANLVTQRLDYLLTATVVESRTGQGGKEVADLKGIPIPIRITGPFAAPKVRPDLQTALKGQVGKVVEHRLKKEIRKRLKGKVPEELQRNLQDTLKGLFR